MQFDILTLFPDQVRAMLDASILQRAQTAGLITIKTHDLRPFGLGPHQTVDDTPYGGGKGMVLKPDVVVPAIKKIAQTGAKPRIILLTPQGERFSQAKAEQLAQEERLLLVAGHYEGFDERIRAYVDEELSLGDFVLTGGELAAAVVVDAVARLVP
ncbi:MAG: tRNA (guanosine(37)-N1)-methyltransferase TrmD, partial [bacterium]|nr:tRNA (guanosine(37)-N1)-methyltransferase TrmD [bacterium]